MSKSEMKHTPGPWQWYGDNMLSSNKEEVLEAGDDRRPYGMHSPLITHHYNEEIKEANKRLIAAAPELLEALKVLRVSIPSKYKALRDIAERAVAKATGSAQ